MRSLPFIIMRAYATVWTRKHARVVVKGLDEIALRRKGERRVYLLLDRSTTFDIMALLHVSEEPFAIMMERTSFGVPGLRRLQRAAGLIPLDAADPRPALEAGAAALDRGRPLLASLRAADGSSARTDGIRLARERGAALYPIFLKAEDDRVRTKTFRGRDGIERPYTTFKDSFYFIEFLRPFDLSGLSAAPSEAELAATAAELDARASQVDSRYETFLADNRERFADLKRRGGTRYRVAW
jgi:1-acyl-sn-glycerol-3-phosphate acyltransferase